MGHGVPERAETVAVEDRANVLAVGREHHRGAVPRFHHAGMEFVEVLFLLRHRLVLIPRFGNHHEHGMGQFAAGHHQQFQGAVEAGGVAGGGVADRRQFVDVVAVQRRAELLLAGVHPVDVPANRVDLAVVRKITVWVGQLPVSKRIRAEPGVDQCECRNQRFVVEVKVEAGELVRNEQSLVDHGVAAEAAHVEEISVVFGIFRLPGACWRSPDERHKVCARMSPGQGCWLCPWKRRTA